MGRLMQLIYTGIVDPLYRSRRGWFVQAWIVAVLLIVVGYLYATDVIVVSFSVVVFEALPGGLATQGVGMLTAGALLAAVLLTPNDQFRSRCAPKLLWLLGLAFGWIAFGFFLAPYAGGERSWIGTAMWAVLMFWPLSLAQFCPAFSKLLDDDLLLAAAHEVGIDDDHAQQLAAVYLHGAVPRAHA